MLSLSCKEKIVIQVFSFSWHLYQASYFKITALNEHVLEKKKNKCIQACGRGNEAHAT